MGAGHWVIWTLAAIGFVSLVRIIVDGVAGPRRRRGCGRCGYDVRTIEGWTCPECGADLREEGVLGPALRLHLAARPWVALLAWTVLMGIVADLCFSTGIDYPCRIARFVRYELAIAPVSGAYPNLTLSARGEQANPGPYFNPRFVRIDQVVAPGDPPAPGLKVERETLLVRAVDAEGRALTNPEKLSPALCRQWLTLLGADSDANDEQLESEATALSELLHATVCGKTPRGLGSLIWPANRERSAFVVGSSTTSSANRLVFDLDDLDTIGATVFLSALWFLGGVFLLRLRRRFLPEAGVGRA